VNVSATRSRRYKEARLSGMRPVSIFDSGGLAQIMSVRSRWLLRKLGLLKQIPAAALNSF